MEVEGETLRTYGEILIAWIFFLFEINLTSKLELKTLNHYTTILEGGNFLIFFWVLYQGGCTNIPDLGQLAN